jgi:hypothetical protein
MFKRSLQLFKATWGVLRVDKTLALFPVLSALATLVVIASFALPVWVSRSTDAAGHTSVSVPGWLLIGIGYLVLSYVTIFFNAGLVIAANQRLTGTGPGTLASGFRGAAAKAGAIAPWALVSATVSVVLRQLEQRAGIVGRLVIGLVGIAWALVTYLVVPILVLEGVGTIDAIKRSAAMFKRTWGENMVGNLGLGLVTFLAVLVGFAFIGGGAALGAAADNALVAAPFVMVGIIWVAVVIAGSAALGGIYRVALYRYAADGVTPAAFGDIDLAQAFRPRRTSRGTGGTGGFAG